MKNKISLIITVIVCLSLIVASFLFTNPITDEQKEILKILIIVCASSALYCFIVGQLSNNYSQMDKLWSLLPIAYTWIIASMGHFNPRLIIIAVLVTLWGIRLTYNFARKGAYNIKFWTGVEDYRWKIVRANKIFKSKFAWALFNLFFISIYQNFIVLAICLPALVCVNSSKPFNLIDVLASTLVLIALIIETIADEEQWDFHSKKKQLLSENNNLNELPHPYNKGFNTIGLWNRSRHPNYLGEQSFWIFIYIFAIASSSTNYIFFNWSLLGALLLVLLFLGSSNLGESISSSKYPEYENYKQKVSKYFPNPFKKYE